MRSKPTRPALACGPLLLCLAAAPPAAATETSVFPVDHDLYPYYPSLVEWNRSTAPFTEPSVCAGCHPQQFDEWTGSVHALAFQDPIYQGELNKGFRAVGHEVTRQCEGCHSPAGMVAGEVKGPGLAGLSAVALAGVSCDICHSISGVTHTRTPSREPENGSIVLAPGEDSRDGAKLIKRGPNEPADGCGGGFHECARSPLHLQADLCAGCHQVYHYDDHFPLEATYNEWKHGPYAQRGIMCQDCHMVDHETFLRTADTFVKPRRAEYRHVFAGANDLLYSLAEGAARKAGDGALASRLHRKLEMAIAKLQAAADLEIAPVYAKGQLVEIRVRVKNVRAGHNLPTSLTNVREMWLEVTARDAAGDVVLADGGLDRRGTLVPNTRVFNSEGMGKDFHFAVDPWVVTAFSRHETIPPHGYRDCHFGLRPIRKQGQVSVEARLRYRQADQEVARKILGEVPQGISLEKVYGIKDVPPLPIVEMAAKRARFDSRR